MAEQVCADVLERFGERRFDTEEIVRGLDGDIVRWYLQAGPLPCPAPLAPCPTH